MIAELLLTLCVGGGIAAVVFLLFFNTAKKPEKPQKNKPNRSPNKHKSKKKKKPQKTKPKKKSHSELDVERKAAELLSKVNPALLKPAVALSDSKHLVSVFRGHIGDITGSADITGLAWHQSGKYLFTSGRDKMIYCWQNPTTPKIETEEHFGSIKSLDGGPFTALTTWVTAPPIEDAVDPLYIDHALVEEEKKREEENPLGKYDAVQNSLFASTHRSFSLCGATYELAELEVPDGRRKKTFRKQMKISMTRFE